MFHNLVSTQEADRELADAMSSYWVNFAATGDPNGQGLTEWPAYSAANDLVMGFGESVAPIAMPHKAALDFLDSVQAASRR